MPATLTPAWTAGKCLLAKLAGVTSRRERLLAEGMRLFGEQGYRATSVAQIEEAAGLSPGSGSLYKHFRSKRELLEAGLDAILSDHSSPAPLADRPADATGTLRDAVLAGFARLDQDRDLSRLLFRDLDAFPELLSRFGTEEIARIQQDTARLLAHLAGDPGTTDWAALAVIVQGAAAHFWLLADRFGEHPTGVSRARFAEALAGFTATALDAKVGRA